MWNLENGNKSTLLSWDNVCLQEEVEVGRAMEEVPATATNTIRGEEAEITTMEDLKEEVVNGLMEEKAMGAAMREQAVTKKNERALQADNIPVRQSSLISVF